MVKLACRCWTSMMPKIRKYSSQHKVLHLGAGLENKLGTTIDNNIGTKPDILHDLNIFPWPIQNDSFDAVVMFSVIEHLHEPLRVLEECHRVLRLGGVVFILTPHFSDAASFVDPTHKVHLSARSFDYLISGTDIYKDYGFYSNVTFKQRDRLVMLKYPLNYIPFLQSFVNARVDFYENHLCYFLRGAGLYFELEKYNNNL